jgi:hypothetical protein
MAKLQFLSFAAMQELCPQVSSIDMTAPVDFMECVAHLAAQEPDSAAVLFVTHREGIRDIFQARMKIPYCAIATCTFEDDDFTPEDLLDMHGNLVKWRRSGLQTRN